MKIVHILLSLEMGGAERMAVDLALGQVRRGHRVSMVVLKPGPDRTFANALSDARIECSIVPKKEGLDAKLTPRITASLLRWRAQVVHTHNRVPLIYGALAGRAIGAKVIHTRHGAAVGSTGETHLRRIGGLLVHAYVGVSASAAAVAREAGDARSDKIQVIENGVDVERFSFDTRGRERIRRTVGIPSDAWVLGSVGRLVADKNYGLLLRAAAPLLGERSRLLMVGDGVEKESLQAEARQLGIEPFVHFVGPQRDIAAYLSAMDVFVLSSRTEGLPIALLEAMSNARPIVSTAVGGIPAVIEDGKNGSLVPANSEPELRAALQSFRETPARAEALGRAARTLAFERYGMDRMVEAYLDLYRRVGAPE